MNAEEQLANPHLFLTPLSPACTSCFLSLPLSPFLALPNVSRHPLLLGAAPRWSWQGCSFTASWRPVGSGKLSSPENPLRVSSALYQLLLLDCALLGGGHYCLAYSSHHVVTSFSYSLVAIVRNRGKPDLGLSPTERPGIQWVMVTDLTYFWRAPFWNCKDRGTHLDFLLQ